MMPELHLTYTPEIAKAIEELKGMIVERYPDASFRVEISDEPLGYFLVATVDIEDTDEVFAVVVDRLLDMQVEEGLRVYVTTMRPRERIHAEFRERQAREAARASVAGGA